MSQAFSVSQYGLTIVTGYLLIAHFIGRDLSRFQAGFVNLVFIIMQALTLMSLDGVSRRVQELLTRLNDMDPLLAASPVTAINSTGQAVPWPVYLAGSLMTIGCLIFMWTVRHPNTK